jgi:dienelactone hydrolase
MRTDERLLKRVLKAASEPLVGSGAREELLAHLASRLPRLESVSSKSAWLRRAERTRREALELLFRGHPEGLLDSDFPVEYLGEAYVGPGYRIIRIRYEGYPGLFVPALLYEPLTDENESGAGPQAIPAVLNANGHHSGGKAMAYKQARCINLAKRGMLALNYEFLGMGELSDSRRHNRAAHLDLTGIAGVGVFYLIMKRALDLLVDHPRTDRSRVAMTGLSGGGWQTILLSALDERITVSVPVAGHSAAWQRIHHREDIGDLEQIPSDLLATVDYDVLSGMLAPRPTLFAFNKFDDCCFRSERTETSVIEPARRVFDLLGAGAMMETHVNTDPGTHNYEADNRSALYAFLNKHFRLSTPETDLPWEEEILTEEECRVGLPAGNGTLWLLARDRVKVIARARAAGDARAAGADEAARTAVGSDPPSRRRELAKLFGISRSRVDGVRTGSVREIGPIIVTDCSARIDDTWTVPFVRVDPPTLEEAASSMNESRRRASGSLPRGVEGAKAFRFSGGEVVLAVSDAGRSAALASVLRRCGSCDDDATPSRVFAADVYGTGELAAGWQLHMLVAGSGERPLALQVAQIVALARWARDGAPSRRARTVSLHASGLVMSVASVVAAASEPRLFHEVVTDSLPHSLAVLVEWPVEYEEAPPLFCFGLLERFDIADFIALCEGVTVRDVGRGLLQERAR